MEASSSVEGERERKRENGMAEELHLHTSMLQAHRLRWNSLMEDSEQHLIKRRLEIAAFWYTDHADVLVGIGDIVSTSQFSIVSR